MRPISEILRKAAVAFALLCALGVTSARAQTATPTPSEEELRLQEEKRLVELQRDIEQAKKAIRDAQPQPSPAATPPAPAATPLAGDTTLENVKLEPEMVGYKAMSEAADVISTELQREIGTTAQTVPMPTLAIYDAQVVKDWRMYQALFPAFEGQVKDILNRYTKLLCEKEGIKERVSTEFPLCESSGRAVRFTARASVRATLIPSVVPSAFAAGTNLLKSFVDLTALFRTDTKITGSAFAVDESALVAEVFRALRNKYRITGPGINLYYPEVFPPRLRDASIADPNDGYSKTVTTIGTLFLAKIEADDVIAKLNERKDELGKAIKPTQDRLAPLNEELGRVKALSAELRNLEAALSAEFDPTTRRRLRKEIADVSAALGRLKTQAELEAAIRALKEGIKPQLDEIDQIDENVKSLSELNKRFQTFVDQFVKVDASGINALALFIRSEDIENVMRGDHSYWLEIKSIDAGGNNRVRKNLLRYLTGARLDHSGGVIIEYTLYDKEGNVKYSDKLSIYEGYVEPKTIRNREKFKDAVEP